MARKLSRTDKQQLEDLIGTGQKEFTLLFSATKDGCTAMSFHQKCDNQGATVTVLYNQKDTVYGGYSSLPWNGYTTGHCKGLGAEFLFRLKYNGTSNIKKFPNKNLNLAIYNNPTFGPTFGDNDLKTFQNTVEKTGDTFSLNGSMNNFGNSYESLGVPKSEIYNDTMTVTELEVYKVSDALTRDKTPWRKTNDWNEEVLQSLKENILEFKPYEGVDVTDARIVLVGPVGAGKSSFYNTVDSIITGNITQKACSGIAEQSVTTMYVPYHVRSDGCTPKFRICDNPGLEEAHGLDIIEFNYMLEGNMPGYFEPNPNCPLKPATPGFVTTTTLNDQVHCVVFVLDATTLEALSTKFLEKIKQFKLILYKKGIPHMFLLTKVDKICRDVDNDLTNLYKSEVVKEHVDKAADLLGIPPVSIHPIKNYVNEVECDVNVGIVALGALRHALRCANSFLQVVADRRSDITKGSDTLSSSDDI